MSNTQPSDTERKLEARLREIDAQIQHLAARSRETKEDLRDKSETVLEDLKRQREEVATKMQSVGKKAGAAAGELAMGLQRAMEELGASLKAAASTIKEPNENK